MKILTTDRLLRLCDENGNNESVAHNRHNTSITNNEEWLQKIDTFVTNLREGGKDY